MNEVSRKIVFVGNKADYYKWADAMFSRGFDCSIEQVMDILNVSQSWVRHTLLLEIPYVTYSYKFLFRKGIKSRATTYIDFLDMARWIEQVGRFQIQTELVDLYSYLSLANRKKADAALKMYRDIIKKSNIGYNQGVVPERVLQYINDKYYVNFTPKNLSCVKRRDVAWHDIEPVDMFARGYYFADQASSAELIYREAFMNGDIKLTLGNKKTIFIRSSKATDKMKMPFLIQYNSKIIVQDRR